jgi:hypothetical protein
MPFFEGYVQATDTDLEQEGFAKSLMETILWLARHDLAYVDLRPPNLLISPDRTSILLVDYDDMLVCNGLAAAIEAWDASESIQTLKDVLKAFFTNGHDRKPYFLREEYEYRFSKILSLLENFSGWKRRRD